MPESPDRLLSLDVRPTVPYAPLASPAVYRMTVDEYERMEGVLDDPRVELIDGYLVRKMGKRPPHSWSVERISDLILARLPDGWIRRQEQPVRIPDFDEPEPDVAVVVGPRDRYRVRHPGPGDVTLLIEVSESSLDHDRSDKLRAYARGAIPTYWIVNLVDRRVEVYTEPVEGGYASCLHFTPAPRFRCS